MPYIPGADYHCRYTEVPPQIDGLLDMEVWGQADVLPLFCPGSNDPPISLTEGRLLWDAECLYVGFKAYDRDIWGYFTERDSPTWQEDVLELFFKTDPSVDPYYNFEVNALGTVHDAHTRRLDRSGGWNKHRWSRWNMEGLRVAVHIEGELNNADVEDKYWQLEMALPFAGLPTLMGASPRHGDIWLFHLARFDYSTYLPDGLEMTTSANMPEVDFHDSRFWQRLVFQRG